MMSDYIKQLCALTILFGAAVSLAPEGGAKKIMELTCTVVLALTVILPLKSFDMETYAIELAKYRQLESELAEAGSDFAERLNRLVIEEEYEAYVLDEAKKLCMAVTSVKVTVEWSLDEIWVPQSVTIEGEYTKDQKKKLAGVITSELGLPEDKQHWSGDGR